MARISPFSSRQNGPPKPADTRASRFSRVAIAMDHAMADHRAGAPCWSWAGRNIETDISFYLVMVTRASSISSTTTWQARVRSEASNGARS